MKRRIFEWILVVAVLLSLGHYLRMEAPVVEETDNLLYIATDLPERTAESLVKDYPGNHRFIFLSEVDKSKWEVILKEYPIDAFVGSQDFLLWAARSQHLQPLKSENLLKAEERYTDHLGRWVGIWADPWVVVYNRERMAREIGEANSLWQRKSDQRRYRWIFPDIGNIAGNQENIQFYRGLAYHFGEEEFYEKMLRFKPEIQNYMDNSSHGLRMVLMGQADFVFTHYSDWLLYQRDSLPLSWFSMEVAPSTLYGAGVGRKTKQWEQANKLVDFWQSSTMEWEKKNQIPWLNVHRVQKNLIYAVGGLNDLENQVFLDEWLSEFRFGTVQKGNE